MKMTLNEVEMHFKQLSELGNYILPIRVSYAISSNIKRFSEALSLAEAERIKVCERYADKDEHGKPIKIMKNLNDCKMEVFQIPEEYMAVLNKEVYELKLTEVDIEIQTVKESALEVCENDDRYTMLSLAEISNLSFMLEF